MSAPFVILGCGAEKQALLTGVSVAAVLLYTGPLYRARLAYAEALGGVDLILSGLHGVVQPPTALAPYDYDLTKASRDERREWAARVERILRNVIPPDRAVVALVAGPYLEPLRWLGERLTVPAKGLPIGAARRELQRLTRELGPAGPTVEEELAWLERELPKIDDHVEVHLSAAAMRAALARRAA